ncbi:MAG: serine hydrolase domain-containing protein, partial [Candidatus Hodarchaeota archaeon]
MLKKRGTTKKLRSRHMIIIGASLAAMILVSNFQTLYLLNPAIYSHQQQADRHSKLVSKQNIDEEIISLMGTGHIPSVVAAIIHNDTITWAKGYGDQPSLDTIHLIASISKTITATAILQLYEQGLFGLDDDVNLFLPFSLRNPHFPETPITFRMLLSHTSGINGSQDEYWWVVFEDLYKKMGFMNETESFPAYPTWLSEYLVPNGSLYTTNVWTTSIPGSEEATLYANPGFDLLGYLIQIISNKSLDQYLEEQIFAPLQMTSTGFSMTEFQQDKLVIPYWWNSSKNGIDSLPYYDCYAFGAGAIRTTI